VCKKNVPFKVKSSQVTFIYIALFTIQIASQLYSDNMKVVQHRSIILLNIKYPPTKQAKSKATVERNQNSIRMDGEKTLGEPRLSRGPVLLWLTFIL